MNVRKLFTLLSLLVIVTLLVPNTLAGAAQQPAPTSPVSSGPVSSGPVISGIFRGVSTAERYDVSPALRTMTPLQIAPGTAKEIPERGTGLEGLLGPQDIDPLVQSRIGPNTMPAPLTSFDGPSNLAGVSPPDPVGDVGPNHYVAMSNLYFAVYSKTGTVLYGPAANNTLWAGFGGACQSENAGDPVVLYDQLDDRWILTQFTASGPTYYNCVAVSTTGDPTGSYYRYAFSTGTNFPDYPKYGMWSDALYISTREFAGGSSFAGIGAYAVNRTQLIAGNPAATVISFLAPPAPAYNVGDGLLPTDLDGSRLPPAGTPNFFMGSMDNGAGYGAPQDALTLWKFHADFSTPGNSSFILANTIPVAPFDSIFDPCGGGRACIPQPGTTNKIDILSYRQRPLWRLAYRNFGTYEALVTNQSVEASAGMAGIRWYELRDPNGTPVVYQQSTYSPGTTDGIHRWMGSLAMDKVGNMALGYSASNATTTYPSSWYTGRLATDPLGTMTLGEGSIINGTGSQTGSNRWGDYTSMNIDPVDDCTFWYVNEYVPTTGSNWRLRIGSFKYPACDKPDFTLEAAPESQSVCAPDTALYNVTVGQIVGFNQNVTLTSVGKPADTTAVFNPNPVTPPGSSELTIGDTISGTPGLYSIDIIGSAVTQVHTATVGLELFTALPGDLALLNPAPEATNQPTLPTFTWSAASQAKTYVIQVATDPEFTNVVISTGGITGTQYTPVIDLALNTVYYWRVRATNTCGDNAYSTVSRFLTRPAVGECSLGTVPNTLLSQGFETGLGDWAVGGTGASTWALSTSRKHSGAYALKAADITTVSDQQLVSPAFLLPADQSQFTLKYYDYRRLQTGGCFDGGILEASTDSGTTWTQVLNPDLLTGPYDGQILPANGNPLAGLDAWCLAKSSWTAPNIVSLDAFAGETVNLRLRFGTDSSTGLEGWYVDDVSVQSCVAGVTLTPDAPRSAAPGQTVTHTIVLTNGGAADTFALALTGNAWASAIVSPNPVSVGSGAAVEVKVHVTVPADFTALDDTFTLTATSASIPGLTVSAQGKTQVAINPGVTILPAAQEQNTAPGAVVTYTFTVSNTGDFTDTFALGVTGVWTATLPGGLTTGPLAAGASKTVTVVVIVPLDAVEGASDVATLTATSGWNSTVNAEATATTRVATTFWIFLPVVLKN